MMPAPVAHIRKDALVDFMTKEGLRLVDLHKATGVSQGFLSELCSGTKGRCSVQVARKIADALNVRVSSITEMVEMDGAA